MFEVPLKSHRSNVHQVTFAFCAYTAVVLYLHAHILYLTFAKLACVKSENTNCRTLPNNIILDKYPPSLFAIPVYSSCTCFDDYVGVCFRIYRFRSARQWCCSALARPSGQAKLAARAHARVC